MDNVKSRAKVMDLISGLPNEVLEKIVSLLPLKEAGRTSVLGHGWKTLWMSARDLDFDVVPPAEPSSTLKEFCERIASIRERFVHWVSAVVNVHNGAEIAQFRIQCGLDRNFACYFDRWLRFAFSKRVKRLELDLRGYGAQSDQYAFPNICETTEQLRVLPFGCSSIYFLQSLSLKRVDVTGQVLEYFIANCPFLERLCVQGSLCLHSLKIRGSLRSLKRVEICYCPKLVEFGIIAPNVVDLLCGTRCSVDTSITTPSLKNLTIEAGSSGVSRNFTPFYRYFNQLETLSLHLAFWTLDDFKEFADFPNLVGLKKLEIQAMASDRESLLPVASLINAAPILNEFSLKLHWIEKLSVPRAIQKARGQPPHKRLKMVEIIGYVGAVIDTEFVDYLLETAVSLEKFVIDPQKPPSLLTAWHCLLNETEVVKTARERAKQLKDKLPAGAEFIIL